MLSQKDTRERVLITLLMAAGVALALLSARLEQAFGPLIEAVALWFLGSGLCYVLFFGKKITLGELLFVVGVTVVAVMYALFTFQLFATLALVGVYAVGFLVAYLWNKP